MTIRVDSVRNEAGATGLIRRRGVLRGVSAVPAVFAALAFSPSAAAGLPALVQPALPVRSPDLTFLIAAARSGLRVFACGGQGVLLFSDDNGVSWKQAQVPVSGTLIAMDFADAMNGWAVGALGVILKTDDGGRTWHKQLDGTAVNEIMAKNAAAFAAANPNAPAAQRALKRANIFSANGPDKPFLCILAINTKQAIAFGSYRMAMRTDDGGKTWVDISLAVDDPISHNLYGVLNVGGRIFVAAETGVLFCSTDGGQTFPQITSPASATLFGVCTDSAGDILIYGVAAQIFRSQDNGASWQPGTISTAGDIYSAGLAKNQLILACAQGVLCGSNDKSANFLPVSGYSPSMQVNALVQAPDGALVLAGSAGVQRVTL